MTRVIPKPEVPCKKCGELYKRHSKFTKLCGDCWDEAQGKRITKWHK